MDNLTPSAPIAPAVAPPVPQPTSGAPSLNSLVGSVPQQEAPSPAPVTAPSPDIVPQSPDAGGGLATELRSRGFDVPENMTQQQVIDTLAAQIDEANLIRDERQQQPAGVQAEQQPAALSPHADPAAALHNNAPAAPAASQQPTDLSQPVELSQDARILAQQGLVYQNEDGSWASKNPAFQSFADEHNRLGAWRQAVAMRFMDNPDSFIQERLQTAQLPQNQDVQALQEQVQALTDRLNAGQKATEKAKLSSWVDEHSQSLFVNGDRNQLTPYAQRYNAIAKQIDGVTKQAGQRMSRSQLHQQTLQMLESTGITPEAVPPQPVAAQPHHVPQPQQQQQHQQQTFMQSAAQATPQQPVNRLIEHPAMQPNGTAPPTSKFGRPSLAALIEQQKQL